MGKILISPKPKVSYWCFVLGSLLIWGGAVVAGWFHLWWVVIIGGLLAAVGSIVLAQSTKQVWSEPGEGVWTETNNTEG